MHSSLIYNRILSRFSQRFSFCFAYGSGVKQQIGYENVKKKKETMIDFIFCVNNSLEWHSLNLKLNPQHYSGLKSLGANFITKFQENVGAKVYCNTLIPLEDEDIIFKYGVMTTSDLLRELLEWPDLYLAGRLHKPVEIIHEPSDEIRQAMKTNLTSALSVALLLLPEKFTKYNLFHTISNLSYSGDFRMIFGESKDKVNNIVRPQLEQFENLYRPTLKEFEKFVSVNEGSDEIQQDLSSESRIAIFNQIPREPKIRSLKLSGKKTNAELIGDSQFQKILSQSLKDIVWQSSVKQSIKNIPTAGFSKSIRYSWKKALKTFS